MARVSDPVPSTPEVSARMSRQGRRDTAPEVAVRRLLHASGLRYRVNVPVPGMPRRTIDIVFSKAKIAIFMDGCFWHGCPEHATQPKSNAEWWRTKLDKNMARDVETSEHLRAQGWTVLRFWEHQAPGEVAEEVRNAVIEAGATLLDPPFSPRKVTLSDESFAPGRPAINQRRNPRQIRPRSEQALPQPEKTEGEQAWRRCDVRNSRLSD